MIRYEGMKAEEQKSNDFGHLPAGPYVARVLSVKIDGNAPDQSLVLALDVIEGEYKDFFMKKYTALKESGSQFGEVKFKGTYRLRIPNPQNTNARYPESDVARMNDMIFRFEKSNPGYHWDCDEQKLVGLTVGINMQEDTYNDVVFTRIGRLEIADDVRKGLVKAMKPRKRQEAANPMTTPFPAAAAPQFPAAVQQKIDMQTGMPIVNTEDLPF